MSTFRIISEPDPARTCRESRGTRLCSDDKRVCTVVETVSLAGAAVDARDTEPHRDRRIVSVEEVHRGFAYSDEDITAALTVPRPELMDTALVDSGVFEDTTEPLYLQEGFTDTVRDVVDGLRESSLVPGLNMSVLDNETDEPYAMLEVRDEGRFLYLSRGCEIRKLTDDRDAAGWDGVLAIARQLIDISNDLH
ncbi:hypothetical protein [Arthrobacter castelli]|uniref:hypothetical protein n=1 Tax=Arthrobacter castelli TaxID=271431 RepID=UPI0004086F1D|nr:hypothetical protein [Arthrobacter castelli]